MFNPVVHFVPWGFVFIKITKQNCCAGVKKKDENAEKMYGVFFVLILKKNCWNNCVFIGKYEIKSEKDIISVEEFKK